MSLFTRSDDTGTIFRDVIFLMMITFVILFLIAVLHINPVAEPKEEEMSPPGNIVVNIFWEDEINVDVDLWVKGPKDIKPVGYSNRAGRTFNLLRDDLGTTNDDTEMNFENVYSRGIPDGEYIINVHMYSNKQRPQVWPVTVKIIVTLMNPENSKNAKTEIFIGDVNLSKHSEEITAVRFKIKNKKVVPESVNSIQLDLKVKGQYQWNF